MKVRFKEKVKGSVNGIKVLDFVPGVTYNTTPGADDYIPESLANIFLENKKAYKVGVRKKKKLETPETKAPTFITPEAETQETLAQVKFKE